MSLAFCERVIDPPALRIGRVQVPVPMTSIKAAVVGRQLIIAAARLRHTDMGQK
jgi:hypothetical protein